MPLPAIVVPRSHLLPNDSETAPASPCVQYITWIWFTWYRVTPHISHKVPPHPNNVAMVPTPMVPCARSLGKECYPLSGFTGAPHCKYWSWNRQGSHFAGTSAPSPSTHTHPVLMVPPSWPCLLCPNEKLSAQATHQQTIIRIKHSSWHISPFGKLWS